MFGKDESDDMRLIGNQLIKCATAVVAHVVSFPDLSPPLFSRGIRGLVRTETIAHAVIH